MKIKGIVSNLCLASASAMNSSSDSDCAIRFLKLDLAPLVNSGWRLGVVTIDPHMYGVKQKLHRRTI